MGTIGVYQSLSNNAFYEYICLENIKMLYKSACNCDYEKQYKTILEAVVVSDPEGIIYNSPFSLSSSIPVNNLS